MTDYKQLADKHICSRKLRQRILQGLFWPFHLFSLRTRHEGTRIVIVQQKSPGVDPLYRWQIERRQTFRWRATKRSIWFHSAIDCIASIGGVFQEAERRGGNGVASRQVLRANARKMQKVLS